MTREQDKRVDLTLRWTRAQPNVVAFVRSIVRDQSDVDDLVQETAHRIAVKFDDFDPSRPFVAWALGIARNCIREWRRAEGRDVLLFDDQAIQRVAETYAERSPEHAHLRLALERCIEELSPSARRLLELRYAQNAKPSQIAEKTSSTSASVSSTLYRIRESLRQCIETAPLSESEVSS